MKPLFEKIEIPKEWEIAPLENITKITRLAGYEYSTIWEHDPKGKIIALRGFNIQKNRLDLTDIDRISEQLSNQLSRSKLVTGSKSFLFLDLLFTLIIDFDFFL